MSEITQSGLYPFDLRIGSTQRLLSSHWAMGALMVLAVQNAATRFDLTQTHKSIGVSVLVLTLLRLGMRCFFRAPKLEPTARSVVIVGRGRARRPARILLTITPTAHWLEYLDIAGAILAAPHRAVDGTVYSKRPWLRSGVGRERYRTFHRRTQLTMLAVRAPACALRRFTSVTGPQPSPVFGPPAADIARGF